MISSLLFRDLNIIPERIKIRDTTYQLQQSPTQTYLIYDSITEHYGVLAYTKEELYKYIEDGYIEVIFS